jgi:hypothetical protein
MGGIARIERACGRTAYGWVLAKFVGLAGEGFRNIAQIQVSALGFVHTRFQREQNLFCEMKGFGSAVTLLQAAFLEQQMDLPGLSDPLAGGFRSFLWKLVFGAVSGC